MTDKMPVENYTKPCDGRNSNVCVAEGCFISKPDGIPDCVRLQMKNRSASQTDFPVKNPVAMKIWSEIKRYMKALTLSLIVVTSLLVFIYAVSWIVNFWMSGHALLVFVNLVLWIAAAIYAILGVRDDAW